MRFDIQIVVQGVDADVGAVLDGDTRGLVELIVLNLGYDLGVLSPTVFTMMVLMALVTTFMTAPALYPEHDIFIQLMKLKNTLRWMRGEDLITHLGLEYYD